MNFRILKKDLTKKKTIHFILVIFIFLATTFIAGSISNLLFVMNGTQEFMEVAKVPDYITGTISYGQGVDTDEEKRLEDFLGKNEKVNSYSVDNSLFVNGNNFELENGEYLKLNASAFLCSYDIEQIRFFDLENNEITEIEDGVIYFIRKIMSENEELAVGDKIVLVGENDYRKEFTFGGYMKDAIMGSELIGNYRAIVSSNDYEEVAENSGLGGAKFYSVWTDDVQGFKSELTEAAFNTSFTVDKSIIKTSYMMDLIMAAVFMILSVCLIVVSVLMLRFTIIFTINENYKEIGIMKAIGLKDSKIRMLYVSKYFVVACVGAVAGFLASIYVAKILLEQVSVNLVVTNSSIRIFEQLIVSALLVVLITLFAYWGTAKIKKMSPLDAIRSGSNGERFTKKGVMKLAGKKRSVTSFLAGNDVISEWKKYIVLLLTSLVGIWLVVMPISTINTMSSDELIVWLGLRNSDVLIIDGDAITNLSLKRNREAFEEYIDDVKELFVENDIAVESMFYEVQFRFKFYHDDIVYECSGFQGICSDTKEYVYLEGSAPVYANEIALSCVSADALNAKVGDTIYILNGSEKQPFVVTAIYQSMLNMGESARFTDEAELDYGNLGGSLCLQADFKEDVDIDKIEEIVTAKYEKADVMKPMDYMSTMTGNIVSMLKDMKLYIVLVVVLINVLVVSLMQKMFLTKERGQIAMLKMQGFDNVSIGKWQIKRIMLVVFAGVLVGTLTGSFFSQLTAGAVFKAMGLSEVAFVINPLEVYVIYPIILFIAVVLAAMIGISGVRRISEKEIRDME